MRWTPGGESQDVEDRRDESGGGGGGFQFGGMHIGIGGAILLLILSFVFKTNFFALLSGGGSASPGTAAVRKPGRSFCRNKGESRTATRSWCSSGTPSNRDAAEQKPRQVRFIVRATRGFTS